MSSSEPPRTESTALQSPPVPDSTGGQPAVWDPNTKRIVLVLLLALAALGLWLGRGVLPWVIIAGIISYVVSPIVELLTRLRLPRTVATILVFLVVLVLLILVPVFLVPVVINQLRQLAAFDVGRTATSVFAWLLNTINELPDEVVLFGFTIPTGNFVATVEEAFREVTFVPTLAEVLGYIQRALTTATGIVTSTAALSVAVVTRILQVLVTLLLIFFMSLYMTKDAPQIRRYFEELFPTAMQSDMRELLRRMGLVWSSFFRGQMLLCAVIGVVTWLALTAVAMPGALVLAIIAGVLEVVPQFGPTAAAIPAVIVALIQGSPLLAEYGVGNVGFALIIIALYFIVQQVEASVLVPRIIGDSVSLHPVVVIVGVAVGFSAFGVLGALLAAPTLASFRVVGSYIHARLLDYPPFQGKALGGSARAVYRVQLREPRPAWRWPWQRTRPPTPARPSGGLPDGPAPLSTSPLPAGRVDLRSDPDAYASAVAELPPLPRDESSARATEGGARVPSSPSP